MAGEFQEIRQRLEGIAEELADLALERLRESIDAGGTELPVDERRLTRARRAAPRWLAPPLSPDPGRRSGGTACPPRPPGPSPDQSIVSGPSDSPERN